jgi:hypothetical protein
MINWISIDDVLYQFNGQDIVCETGVGYAIHLDGNQLDGIDITNNAGDISGQLYVDFSSGLVSYAPYSDAESPAPLHYSVDGVEGVIALSALPIVTSLHDVIGDESNDLELWSSIADTSQVKMSAAMQSDTLHDGLQTIVTSDLLLNSESSLDAIFQNMNTLPSPQEHYPEISSSSEPSDDLDVLYFQANIVEPPDYWNI